MASAGHIMNGAAAAAAAQALADMGRVSPPKPIEAAQQAIVSARNPQNKIVFLALRDRIAKLKGELSFQNQRISALMDQFTQKTGLRATAANELSLLVAALNQKKAQVDALQKECDAINSESDVAKFQARKLDSELRETQEYFYTLEDGMDDSPSGAAAASSEPKPPSKRTREDEPPTIVQKKAAPPIPYRKAVRGHDQTLISSIFKPGTEVWYKGTKSTLEGFNDNKSIKISQITGTSGRSLDVAAQTLRYCPQVGEICLIRSKSRSDIRQHYYFGKVITVTEPTLRKTNPTITVKWIEYPDSPIEEREIQYVDTVLPLTQEDPLLSTLRSEPVRHGDQIGTGYFLAKK